MKNLFKVLLFLLLPIFSLLSLAYPNKVQAAHGGCHLFVSTTTIAPHGGFNVTVSNGKPGLEYIIVYDAAFYSTVFIMPTSGSFTTFVDVDDIFGASSPQAVSGTFDIVAGTTFPLGFPDAEICEPQKITMEVTGPIPPTANIKANGSDGPITIPYNTSAIISWTSTDATSCSVSPGGFSGTSGSQSTGNLTSTTTYTLTCNGAAGTTPASDSVTINTTSPPTPTPTPTPTPSPTPTPAPTCNISPNNVDPGDQITVTGTGGLSGEIRMAQGTTSSIFLGTLSGSSQTVTVPLGTAQGFYIVRVGLFAVTCGNLTVNAPPPPTCSTPNSPLNSGDTITVSHRNFATGESVRLFGTNAQLELGTTLESLNAQRDQGFIIPLSVPTGSYNIVIVTRFPVISVTCSGGPFTVTGPPPTCSISPSSLFAGDPLTIRSQNGAAGEIRMTGAFSSTSTLLGTLAANGTESVTVPASTPVGLYAIRVGAGSIAIDCGALDVRTHLGGCPGFIGYSPDPPVLQEQVWVMFLAAEGDPDGTYWLAWAQPNSGEKSAYPLYVDKTTAIGFGAWIVTLNGLDEQTDWQLAQTMPDGTNVPCASGSLYPGVTGELTETCGWLRFPSPGNEVVVGPIKNCDLTTPGGIISAILPIIFGLAGFLSIIMIVISGIQFISSSGNPEAAAGARNRLIFALVGFGLIILAFAILQIVDKFFLGGSGLV